MPLLLTATVADPGTPGRAIRVPVDLRWYGPDGSVWPFGSSGPVTLESIAGIGVPPPHGRYTVEAVGVAGAQQVGTQLQEKDVTLGIAVWSSGGSAAWVQGDSAWWDSLDRDVEGYLSATVLGKERRLPLRYAEASETYSRDPVLFCLGQYAIRMVASQPLWEGSAVIRSWSDPAPRDFYDPDPGVPGGVVHIMTGNALGSAKMPNPGDEPAWPVWTVTGPCDTVSVGVGTALVEFGAPLDAGEVLTIDTRPGRLSIRDGSGSRATDVTSAKFARVPAGAFVDLAITATATGFGFSVTAELTPLYRRAW